MIDTSKIKITKQSSEQFKVSHIKSSQFTPTKINNPLSPGLEFNDRANSQFIGSLV